MFYRRILQILILAMIMIKYLTSMKLPTSVVYIKFGYNYNHRTFGRNHNYVNGNTFSKYNQIIKPTVLPHFLHISI